MSSYLFVYLCVRMCTNKLGTKLEATGPKSCLTIICIIIMIKTLVKL